MLVAMHHFLFGDFLQIRTKRFHVDNMKQLFQDIDSIMAF